MSKYGIHEPVQTYVPQLIQTKRLSETEWDIKNKLPVSFATLVTPAADAPPDLIDLRKSS